MQARVGVSGMENFSASRIHHHCGVGRSNHSGRRDQNEEREYDCLKDANGGP
jgi:hypothetical protein